MPDRADVLLAALAASNSRVLTPVQVQKAMFLVAMEARAFAPPRFFTFEKYNYGPFSSEIYSELSDLEARGLVSVEQPPGTRVRRYRLTDSGAEAAQQAELSPTLSDYLTSVVRWVSALSFQDLVRAIYKKYPEYKENSIFSS